MLLRSNSLPLLGCLKQMVLGELHMNAFIFSHHIFGCNKAHFFLYANTKIVKFNSVLLAQFKECRQQGRYGS